eukprot:GGOE01037566.1.p1 GENE.GGOE01037566.1~~GGOE01037566.1.p1  ORF type:complete len:773 (-),score=182.55 GGOE01037566.1:14-2332(-)
MPRPSRVKPKRRWRTHALEQLFAQAMGNPMCGAVLCATPPAIGVALDVDWAALPPALDPATDLCHLQKSGRAHRKRAQLASLAAHVLAVVRDGDVCVDFGAGAGHLGLLVAYLKPRCTVLLVERKPWSLRQCEQRLSALPLRNCEVVPGDLQSFAAAGRRFDVGMCLHACGPLTDEVLELCVKHEAAFVLCPCCYAQLPAARSLPCSNSFREAKFTSEDFALLAAGAEFAVVETADDWDFVATEEFSFAKRCMQAIDADRRQYAHELAQYATVLCSLSPLECSAKNNILIGTAPGRPCPLCSPVQCRAASSCALLVAPATWDPALLADPTVSLATAEGDHMVRTAPSEPQSTTGPEPTTPTTGGGSPEDVPGDADDVRLSYVLYDPSQYTTLLDAKVEEVRRRFTGVVPTPTLTALQVFPSAPSHYRLRARFAVVELPDCLQQTEDLAQADACGSLTAGEHPLAYCMWDRGGPGPPLSRFPLASQPINALMPRLLAAVERSPELRQGLRAVHFHGTLAGDMAITLVYATPLPPAWSDAAAALREMLGAEVVGRSRGAVLCIHRDWVEEVLSLPDGRVLRFQQVVGAFSNPNGGVNTKALGWMCSVVRDEVRPTPQDALLELYCGNGNHTCALAGLFERVVCVEIDKRLCSACEANVALNGLTNVEVVHLPSHRFCRRAIARGTVPGLQGPPGLLLVDPPRAGLDADTIALAGRCRHVLYVSCNPEALLRDLRLLTPSHEVVRMAVFDHFAYTNHLECAVYLRQVTVTNSKLQ